MWPNKLWRAFKDAVELSDSTDKAIRWLGLPISVGAVTAVLGFVKDQPHIAVLVASATFAVLTFGLVKFIDLRRKLEAYRLLTGDGAMAVASVTNGADTIVNVQLILRNASQRLLFYKLVEGSLTVNGRTNQDARLITSVEPALAGDGKHISIASVIVPNHIGKIDGVLKVVIHYGLKATKMGYVYHWDTSLEGESMAGQNVVLRTGNHKNEHSQIVIED
ncbi:MAG: hypothetical protein ABL897_03570 [Hyphomicrobium sp.]